MVVSVKREKKEKVEQSKGEWECKGEGCCTKQSIQGWHHSKRDTEQSLMHIRKLASQVLMERQFQPRGRAMEQRP